MLMNHSSLFYPSVPTVGKYFSKTNIFFSANHKTNVFSMKNDEKCSFKTCCMTPTLEVTAAAAATDSDGIGIFEFFEGKNIFVTGATGLLGKVFVEKLLRSTSVGKVYLLIKAKDKEAAFDRLNREVLSSELFTCLKENYGECYGDFVREKVIPVVGDICEPNLGMDNESIEAIRKDVHVIIHSAGWTTLNGRYDLLVDRNVIASQRVMRFAKTCNKLHLFTHVSSAYVNERRDEGVILEKPFIMGGNGADVDVADEISLLLKTFPNYDDAKFFRMLGQQRAEKFGRSNTYQLSKAMGEMALNEIRGNVPLLIIRPSSIESCYLEPLPGWIQGFRICDPMIVSYGKGLLPAFFGNPQTAMDIIPVDLVANTMIAAIAKHGNVDSYTQEPSVYHVASSDSNPITQFDMFEYLYECFEAAPLMSNANISKIKFFENFEEFSKYTREEMLRQCKLGGEDRQRIRECNAKIEYVEQLAKTYEFATFFKASFDTGNAQRLIEKMSREEQLNFEVDVKNIDWKRYFQEIHVPGLTKYVINTS